MKKLHMQLVSLLLLSGVIAFGSVNGTHHPAPNSTQPATSQPVTFISNGSLNLANSFADGTDPVPAPMPLPHGPRFTASITPADGTDPVPAPMPLPHGPRFTASITPADGTDPVPAPMPLPHGPRFTASSIAPDGTDPVPAPMPLPGRPRIA